MQNKKLYAKKIMGESIRNRGWTLQEVANLIEVKTGSAISRSMVQKWVSGTRPITEVQAILLASMLDMKVSEMVEGR